MADEAGRRRDDERRRRILELARERADAEGWGAVTTRHLATAIGYTQPVLYRHFPGGKAEIMLAVALEGFAELTRRCRAAVAGRRGRPAIETAARAYLDFAREHPAVYEAMFEQVIGARFASADTPQVLREGFETLAAVLGDDGETTTEVFWAALHGMSELERAGRMRAEHRDARVAELAARFG